MTTIQDRIAALYWRVIIVRLSLRWIFALNLGDEVKFRGARWTLVQGVCAPYWDLARGDEERAHAHASQFQKVITPASMWRSFKHGYRFYMRSWYYIWRTAGIEPWMTECNIWHGRPLSPRRGVSP